MEILKGMALLLLALSCFSVFSLKAPNGQKAMSGLANAAVATFLVEALHKFISGNMLGIAFLGNVGSIVGGLGGVASGSLVMLALGINPVFALATGLALSGMGILEGFIVGYALSFLVPLIEKHLPEGVDVIVGVLVLAPLGRFIAEAVSPIVTITLNQLGVMILNASNQSPILMGLLLGGLIKVICTAPLSSMALTAILGLTGLPMGIECVACFGGCFANGITFYRLKLGSKSKTISMMLEPLTQADIVTANPVPIFSSSFVGGALAGLSAAYFNIIADAPGTASPIPGLLTPFAFNPVRTVALAMFFAMIGGIAGGFIMSTLFLAIKAKKESKSMIQT
ncbi:MAG: transcriptional regulator [Fusobacteriia bacterium 4572_74]|nr:MAG: transcriptional regulator [Fusobacteriia bacterium 4572_74]